MAQENATKERSPLYPIFSINDTMDFVKEIGKIGGKKASVETVASVIGNDGHRLEDMYVVMNSLVNDYNKVVSPEDTDTYVKMAHAWLDDVDAKEHKLWKYFIG